MKAEVKYVGRGGRGDKLYQATIIVGKTKFTSFQRNFSDGSECHNYLDKKSCQKKVDDFNSTLASHVREKLDEILSEWTDEIIQEEIDRLFIHTQVSDSMIYGATWLRDRIRNQLNR